MLDETNAVRQNGMPRPVIAGEPHGNDRPIGLPVGKPPKPPDFCWQPPSFCEKKPMCKPCKPLPKVFFRLHQTRSLPQNVPNIKLFYMYLYVLSISIVKLFSSKHPTVPHFWIPTVRLRLVLVPGVPGAHRREASPSAWWCPGSGTAGPVPADLALAKTSPAMGLWVTYWVKGLE